MFQEDYDREREAREAALKVKSLAENKMNRMEEELRECRERLNNQAASQMTVRPPARTHSEHVQE